MFFEQARLFLLLISALTHRECGRADLIPWLVYHVMSCTRRPAEEPIISPHQATCMYIYRSHTLNDTIIRRYHHPNPQRLDIHIIMSLECRARTDILYDAVSFGLEPGGNVKSGLTHRKLSLDFPDRAVQLSRDHQLLVVGE